METWRLKDCSLFLPLEGLTLPHENIRVSVDLFCSHPIGSQSKQLEQHDLPGKFLQTESLICFWIVAENCQLCGILCAYFQLEVHWLNKCGGPPPLLKLHYHLAAWRMRNLRRESSSFLFFSPCVLLKEHLALFSSACIHLDRQSKTTIQYTNLISTTWHGTIFCCSVLVDGRLFGSSWRAEVPTSALYLNCSVCWQKTAEEREQIGNYMFVHKMEASDRTKSIKVYQNPQFQVLHP